MVPEAERSGQALRVAAMALFTWIGGSGSQILNGNTWGLALGTPVGSTNPSYTTALPGSSDVVQIFGDSSGTVTSSSNTTVITLANDTITGRNGVVENDLYGDAYELVGRASTTFVVIGGNDTISGSSTGNATNVIFGDAYRLRAAKGGNDTLNGGSYYNYIYGDGYLLEDLLVTVSGKTTRYRSQGGNDAIAGGDATAVGSPGINNNLYGDGYQITGLSIGGNDTIRGGNYTYRNIIVGDAYILGDGANATKAGIDNLRGGNFVAGTSPISGQSYVTGVMDTNKNNWIYGDAIETRDGTICGDDILTGGDGSTNYLFGDADTITVKTTPGKDLLISGTGTDVMWGDASTSNAKGAADVFQFGSANGNDAIVDFNKGSLSKGVYTAVDKIRLLGVKSSTGVTVSPSNIFSAGVITAGDSTDTLFKFQGGSIWVYGVSASSWNIGDFLFS